MATPLPGCLNYVGTLIDTAQSERLPGVSPRKGMKLSADVIVTGDMGYAAIRFRNYLSVCCS